MKKRRNNCNNNSYVPEVEVITLFIWILSFFNESNGDLNALNYTSDNKISLSFDT